MKLVSVELFNFRCFKENITIQFDELTTFIGKNDIGKSTILEALDIFFNGGTIKIDQGDANVHECGSPVEITCSFSDLPEEITIDAGATTSLRGEYLLKDSGLLCIRKTYDCSKSKITPKIEIIANHPTAEGLSNLLELKEKQLQQLIKNMGIEAKLKGNPGMRKAIWDSAEELQLNEVAILVSGVKDERKVIWDEIEKYLPLYALFQSDRSSKDTDDEVQNPMKAAVSAAIAEVQYEIEEIQRKVKEKAIEIAERTHRALQSFDINLAKELSPQFTPPTASKWSGLFSVNMETDDGIPLNKRGSGVRRLILVSFFKAEAERRLIDSDRRSIIYAIEEPETAQHPNNQYVLIESLKKLADSDGCQVFLTTHSPGLAAELPVEGIRYIHLKDEKRIVDSGIDVFKEAAESLGLIPDSRVKVLLCVEGPTDVKALKSMSSALHQANQDIPDLTTDERVAFLVLGGSTLKHWVNENYLRPLNCPEVHIYDNDVASYQQSVNEVNARDDSSWATLTNKHEIESYLHKQAVFDSFGVKIEIVDHPTEEFPATPKAFAIAYSEKMGHDGIMKDNGAKKRLAESAFPLMTADMLKERDPNGEVEGWFLKIAEML